MQTVFIILVVCRHFLFSISYPESFDFRGSIFVTLASIVSTRTGFWLVDMVFCVNSLPSSGSVH